VQLGVEDRDPDAVAGQDVAVGAGDAADQPCPAEAPQNISHLPGGVGGVHSPVIKARKLLLVMPVAARKVERNARSYTAVVLTLCSKPAHKKDPGAMRAVITGGSVTGGFVGRAYSTGSPGRQDVARCMEPPKVTSLGLEVQNEYVILQSEPVGDFVQMELVIGGVRRRRLASARARMPWPRS
jgi:hypothetical protein